MRHLMPARPPRARGLTLIEVMVALVIGTLLLTFAAPMFGDFVVNSRLRESANALMAQALYAQSEALKRNGVVRLTVTAGAAQVTDQATNAVLRTHTLTDQVVATAMSVDFASNGRPMPFPTDTLIDVSYTGVTCSAEMRCPRVRLDGGGGIWMCGNKLNCP